MIPKVTACWDLLLALSQFSLFVSLLVGPWSSRGAEVTVTRLDDDGPGSLRAAIHEVNAAGSGVIHLEALQGVIYLSTPLPEVTAHLTLRGPGPDQLSISGNSRIPILSFASGTSNWVRRLALVDALATGYRHGGAISNAGWLGLENCWFLRNTNRHGWGGAVYNRGGLYVTDSRFESNHAEGEPGDAGSVFSSIEWFYYIGPGGGGAGLGGGLFQESGWVSLTNTVFLANRARGGDGGSIPKPQGTGRGGGPTGGVPRSSEALPEGSADGGFGSGGGGHYYGTPIRWRNGTGGYGGGGEAPGFGGGYTGVGAGIESGGGGAAMGAGIFARTGSVVMVDVDFRNNQAVGGLGLDAENDEHVSGQASGGGGGALGAGLYSVNADINVDRCRFLSNVTTGAKGGSSSQVPFNYGGGQGGLAAGAGLVVDQGRLRVSHSRFEDNVCRGGIGGTGRYGANGGAGFGGGLASIASTNTIETSSFTGNRVFGGKDNPGPRGTVSMGNAYGAGIAIEAGEARIENSTIAANRAEKPLNHQTEGAGIAVGSQSGSAACQVTLRFLTIASNVAAGVPDYTYTGILSPPIRVPGGDGGGLWCRSSNVTVSLEAVVLAANQSATNGDLAGPVISLSRNFVQNPAGAQGLKRHDLTGLNAQLGPLRDNGDGTLSCLPLPDSPLIDAAQVLDLPPTDQRGLPRLSGPTADLGAIEAVSPVPPPKGPSLTLIQRDTDPPEIAFLTLDTVGSHLIVESSSDFVTWEIVGSRFPGQAFRTPLQPGSTFYRVRQVIMPP
ncbi:MAG: hypothetical protein JNK85_18345 [Verrucomicrobiales bacterium]|nr:hypothetical protein [Verrucomicrobiales bacterium]